MHPPRQFPSRAFPQGNRGLPFWAVSPGPVLATARAGKKPALQCSQKASSLLPSGRRDAKRPAGEARGTREDGGKSEARLNHWPRQLSRRFSLGANIGSGYNPVALRWTVSYFGATSCSDSSASMGREGSCDESTGAASAPVASGDSDRRETHACASRLRSVLRETSNADTGRSLAPGAIAARFGLRSMRSDV